MKSSLLWRVISVEPSSDRELRTARMRPSSEEAMRGCAVWFPYLATAIIRLTFDNAASIESLHESISTLCVVEEYSYYCNELTKLTPTFHKNNNYVL